jgi:hypothetical protein
MVAPRNKRQRLDADRCAQGHDLSDARNYRLDDTGHKRCLACKREAARRSPKRKQDYGNRRCDKCGGTKFPDRRRLCFSCSFRQRQAVVGTEAVDAALNRAVAMESARSWEKIEYLKRRKQESEAPKQRGVDREHGLPQPDGHDDERAGGERG